MNFRLVPKSVTLKDVEWRNGPYFCVISPNSEVCEAHCMKVVEDVVVNKVEVRYLLMSFLLFSSSCTFVSGVCLALLHVQ